MIYALIGTVFGVLSAGMSLVLGAPLFVALLIYAGTGAACLGGGFAVAAFCLWRNGSDDRELPLQG
ncbi:MULTISPECIES: hypothetical protein [unclassified Dinoroseobacter]|uniref:hypothetical protein n=1 Tax=unclassified Dinoroseobacter TaxID=2620028 RepID=UPI003C7C3D65